MVLYYCSYIMINMSTWHITSFIHDLIPFHSILLHTRRNKWNFHVWYSYFHKILIWESFPFTSSWDFQLHLLPYFQPSHFFLLEIKSFVKLHFFYFQSAIYFKELNGTAVKVQIAHKEFVITSFAFHFSFIHILYPCFLGMQAVCNPWCWGGGGDGVIFDIPCQTLGKVFSVHSFVS